MATGNSKSRPSVCATGTLVSEVCSHKIARAPVRDRERDGAEGTGMLEEKYLLPPRSKKGKSTYIVYGASKSTTLFARFYVQILR